MLLGPLLGLPLGPLFGHCWDCCLAVIGTVVWPSLGPLFSRRWDCSLGVVGAVVGTFVGAVVWPTLETYLCCRKDYFCNVIWTIFVVRTPFGAIFGTNVDRR